MSLNSKNAFIHLWWCYDTDVKRNHYYASHWEANKSVRSVRSIIEWHRSYMMSQNLWSEHYKLRRRVINRYHYKQLSKSVRSVRSIVKWHSSCDYQQLTTSHEMTNEIFTKKKLLDKEHNRHSSLLRSTSIYISMRRRSNHLSTFESVFCLDELSFNQQQLN